MCTTTVSCLLFFQHRGTRYTPPENKLCVYECLCVQNILISRERVGTVQPPNYIIVIDVLLDLLTTLHYYYVSVW